VYGPRMLMKTISAGEHAQTIVANYLQRLWNRTCSQFTASQEEALRCEVQYVHHGLVRFVFEVGVPELVKFRTHFLQLFFSGTDLQCRDGFILSRGSRGTAMLP
jgi:hypothetical protein